MDAEGKPVGENKPPSDALIRAYRRTTYRARNERGDEIRIRIGEPSAAADAAAARAGADTWAHVSAANPGSTRCSIQENPARHAALGEWLRSHAIPALPGEGVPDTDNWPIEPAYLAFGLTRAEAASLGRRFGQVAIVFGRRGRRAELVFCDALDDGR